ncbi:TetR family transcriptional regulator [Streptomyces sp. NPDC059785]|uniref:TetR family transcriptional regulator n=1 Tax=Streptomyces sp. NPDC059785 TaxID=3346945 RepID=UPI00364DC623
MAEIGLRERKKQRMYRDVSDIAIGLFLEKGFDQVSVAEVAAAAEISKPTLFRYFPAKEDLVLHRFADHETESARLVAERPEGRTPAGALRERFLSGLAGGDPVTGLCDVPEVLAFHRLLYGTPSLVARAYAYQERSEAALAAALGGGLDARLAAGQVIAVQRVLALDNWRRIVDGEPVAVIRPDAVAAAGRAFDRLTAACPELATPQPPACQPGPPAPDASESR